MSQRRQIFRQNRKSVSTSCSALVNSPRDHGKCMLSHVGSYVLCINEIYAGSFKKSCGFVQRTQNSEIQNLVTFTGRSLI